MFAWIKKQFSGSVKSSGVTGLSSEQLANMLRLNSANWSMKSYRDYANEGYIKNIVAYHCIDKLSKAVADIPYIVKINDKEIEAGNIVELLKRPNQKQSYKPFMRELVMYRLISGNSYVYCNVVSTGRVMGFTNFRPDRVVITTNSYCEPIAFDYTINGKLTSYPIDPITYKSEILHIKEPHPLNDLYGLSPIQAAAMSIDQHNESGEWNKKLLENSARPPGILTVKPDGALAGLTEEQLKKISDKFNDKYAGSKNAGKPLVLNFDMVWQSMGMSPSDMDWLNGKSTSARDICLAFGYPSLLLGMPEGSTFNNVGEAKLALYEETVIPLVQSIFGEISHYLTVDAKTQVEIVPDLDKVTALSSRRETTRKTAREDMTAGIITPNEARAEIGYDPVDGADELLVPAGKLPINFDVSSMNKSTYQIWLKSHGFGDEFISQMSSTAYEGKQ